MKHIGKLFLGILCTMNWLGAESLFYETDSDNFVVRWAFQDMCDHVFDPRTVFWAWPTSREPGGVRFDPSMVKAGDLIFVREVELFFKEMHPLITAPYIMITHGEFRDTCMEYHLEYLDDEKIIAWFSIHPTKLAHEKYSPIPLGVKQEKKYYLEKSNFNTLLKDLRTRREKRKLLYLNFDDSQNPEREFVKSFFSSKSFCTFKHKPVPFTDYLMEMAEYKFALSPRGWGPDCYRTWEALYVGCIPIVRRNQFDQLIIRSSHLGGREASGRSSDLAKKCSLSSPFGSQLDKLYEDLPILVIDDWEEITEEFLHQKYKEITSKKYDISPLYMEYWIDKIKAVKDNFFLTLTLR